MNALGQRISSLTIALAALTAAAGGALWLQARSDATARAERPVALTDEPATASTDAPAASAAVVPSAAAPPSGAGEASAPVAPAEASEARDAAEAETAPPLDRLLRLPDAGDAGSGALPAQAPPGRVDPASSAARSPLGRVRVERKTEQLGTDRDTVERTETRVGIPVDRSVELRGGVRSESHAKADGRDREKSQVPTLGVEVQF